MEDSILHNLLYKVHLGDYRESLEKDESDNISKWLKQARENLENNLNADQLKLVDKYKFNLELRQEDIEIQTEIRLLNYGIKIGMELQKAFNNFEEE